MIVRIFDERYVYKLEAPDGSRLAPAEAIEDDDELEFPGPGGDWVRLPRPLAIQEAGRGRLGLRLLEVHRR